MSVIRLALRTASPAALALALAGGLAARPAAAQATNALTGDQSGNASFAGTLSQEFTVGGAPVRITRFGAFDAVDGEGARDGVFGTITVQLFQVVRGATPAEDVVAAYGDALTFTGTQGTLDGAFRYQTLASALELPAGFIGRIGAWGFDGADRYYNAFVADPNGFQRVATNDGGGRVSYGRVYYANVAGGAPTIASGDGSAGWYGAGSFTFEGARARVVTPEPSTWALLGLGLATIGGVAARRRRPA